MMIHICKCEKCCRFYITDNLEQTVHGKGPHRINILESFNIRNEEVIVKHIFDILKYHSGDVFVRLTGNDFSERSRGYLQMEAAIDKSKGIKY